MTLGIVFYKSSSKYYDPTCSKCERFDSYVCEKNKNALQDRICQGVFLQKLQII